MDHTPVILTCCVLAAAGCQTGQALSGQGPNLGSAFGGAAGAILGNQYGQVGVGQSVGSQLGSATGQMAGSALEAQHPSGAPSPGAPSSTVPSDMRKFCPIGGERFAESYTYCPYHGVELSQVKSQPSSVLGNAGQN